ncbi:TetR/AcrR family transcriptional regulator [Ruegeria sp. HKCCA5463]|uniref:TetR/AcrR family transcriptional regulator n=1 Tax=Ruegeria sp. HKCCA5463 TaxID=2682994 RepID=UPI001488DC03|nr:TetR/AcrR family transcriptional regulator [Ruegeria sp. HKCCA5463]
MNKETLPIADIKSPAGPGRPRAFDEADALEKALCVFWHKGYEAASVDDLTKAMGLSRSSFYGTFGNKQALFRKALSHYSRRGLKALRDVADAGGNDPVGAIMEALANPQGGRDGCMLINCLTELAPHDDEVADLGRHHLESIDKIIAEALEPSDPSLALDRARAYASLAIGTLALRKAGVPAEQISQTLKQARLVISP